MPPTVSALIVTANRPDLLRDAVRSVVEQTRAASEIVVVDDSIDATVVKANRLVISDFSGAAPLKYITTGGGKGANRARNLGVTACTAQLVGFLDDDDMWSPAKLAMVGVKAYDKRWDVLYSDYSILDDRRTACSRSRRRLPVVSNFRVDLFIRNVCAPTSGLVVRRRACIEFDEALPAHQDYDWCLRMMAAGAQFVHIRSPLFVYRLHSGASVTRNFVAKRAAISRIRSVRERIYDRKYDRFTPRQLALSDLVGVCVDGGYYKKAIRLAAIYLQSFGFDYVIGKKVARLCVRRILR